jgi:hypothetical protein
MESPDGASAACHKPVSHEQAPVSQLYATQHHYVAFIQSPQKSFHRKIKKIFVRPSIAPSILSIIRSCRYF